MSPFAQLQAQHEALLARQPGEGSQLVEEALSYAEAVRRQSAHVAGARERSQLRANLRYWAGFIYEHTGAYPPTELAPPLQASLAPDAAPPRRAIPLLAGAALLLLLCAGALALLDILPTAGPPVTTLPTRPVVLTAALTVPAEATATGEPTDEPDVEPPPPTTTPRTPAPGAVVVSPLTTVSLTNLRDGDAVDERALLRGIYRYLDESWTLHVLVQPVAGEGRLYPAPEFVFIEPGAPDGEWELTVDFAVPGVDRARFVNLFLVLAPNDRARAALAVASQQGLVDLPSSAILFPEVTTLVYAP